MARRVDQVELISFTIAGGIGQRRRLRFDGDATFLLQFHRIEHLIGFHLTFGQCASHFDQTIGQRRLTMVNMGNNRKIANMGLIHLTHWRGSVTMPCQLRYKAMILASSFIITSA